MADPETWWWFSYTTPVLDTTRLEVVPQFLGGVFVKAVDPLAATTAAQQAILDHGTNPDLIVETKAQSIPDHQMLGVPLERRGRFLTAAELKESGHVR